MTNQRLFIILNMFILIIIMPNYIYANESTGKTTFHFIDVGQGDSMLIQTPKGKTILIDGGPPESDQKLVNYLKNQHVSEIDLLIVTHPDIDHIGGLPHLMRSIQVNKIIESGKFYTTKIYDQYIKEIVKKKIPISLAKRDDVIHLDPLLRIRVLNTYNYFKTNNESSIVLHVEFDEVNFLLMGDVEEKQEKELIEKYNLKVDIIKIAHHGSNTSSSMEFLSTIQPSVALLSYKTNNDFSHPHEEVIDRLKKINTTIYSTAADGDIKITTDGKSFIVQTNNKLVENQ